MGTDPGGDPVPCHSQAVSVHAGCRASRPEKPQCQSFVRNPARLPSPDSSPGEEGCGCQNHRSGQENSPCNGAAHPTWKFSLSTHPVAARRGHTHTHTHADALLLQGHHYRKESHLLAAAGHLWLMGLCQERAGSAGLASPCEQVRTAIGELSKLDLGPCGLKGNPRHSSPCSTPHLFRLNPNKYKVNDLSETIGEIPA